MQQKAFSIWYVATLGVCYDLVIPVVGYTCRVWIVAKHRAFIVVQNILFIFQYFNL